ncbi:MAG: hypothetical protein C0621_02385 [Desulfuromonas sp.]|nr:MAG: hypothetical protein C0621_02385 [Desulfuromonas sp.]
MFRNICILLLLAQFGFVSCSLPPDRPVTRDQLMKTRIYNTFDIVESPEQVLKALNEEGEAILAAKRVVREKVYDVHIKILATSEGLEVLDYDR